MRKILWTNDNLDRLIWLHPPSTASKRFAVKLDQVNQSWFLAKMLDSPIKVATKWLIGSS